MQTLIKKYIPKSAPCDHPWDTSSLIVFVVFLEGFLLLGGLLSTNMLIQIACFLLLPFPILISLHLIRQVNFDDRIMIKPILGKSKTIEYAQLRKFYKHEGTNGRILWILKYDHNTKLKKITFYEPELNFDEFREVLKNLK
jgi:hypothetical protein